MNFCWYLKKSFCTALISLLLPSILIAQQSPPVSSKPQDSQNPQDTNRVDAVAIPLLENSFNQKDLRYLLDERLARNFKDRFNFANFNTYLLESEANRELVFETYARYAKGGVKNSARQAARQFLLETLPVDYWRGEIGLKFSDAFSGREERNTLVDPFNKLQEGIPGFERFEPSRLPSNWKWGVRPFRQNPHGYFTWHREVVDLHLRGDISNLEFAAQLPINYSLSISFAARRPWNENEKVAMFLGAGGNIFKGSFYMGGAINGASSFSLGYKKDF